MVTFSHLIKHGQVTAYKVVGYCMWPKESVLNYLAAGGRTDRIPGDFVLAIGGQWMDQPFTVLAGSAVAAIPYFFYTTKDGTLLHGENLFELYLAVGLEWQWNNRALYCLSNLDHLVGTDTLHAAIQRMPAAATVTNYRQKTTMENFGPGPSPGSLPLSQAVEEYDNLSNDYFRPGQSIFLSLSAGLDSRLLLATCLAKGLNPITATMGADGDTDVRVAAAIAGAMGIKHQVVRLEANDYLDHSNRRQIVYATGGSKTMLNWHTFLYSKKLELEPGTIHFAGANGELARSYYFDKGFFAKILQQVDLGTFQTFFRLKLARGSKVVPESVAKGAGKKLPLWIESLVPAGSTMDRLDTFYTTQRVRHFIGNGLALYNTCFPTQSPFLDYRFLQLARAIRRKDKLNSVFHKRAIQRMMPQLLQFPNADNNRSINDYTTNVYFRRKARVQGYNKTGDLLGNTSFIDSFIEENSLDEWLSQEQRRSLLASGAIRQVSFLVTLAETKKLLNELEQRKRKE